MEPRELFVQKNAGLYRTLSYKISLQNVSKLGRLMYTGQLIVIQIKLLPSTKVALHSTPILVKVDSIYFCGSFFLRSLYNNSMPYSSVMFTQGNYCKGIIVVTILIN